MTSTDNTLELIERLRKRGWVMGKDRRREGANGSGLLVNPDGPAAADLLERHQALAIAAGYPEGVEAMAADVERLKMLARANNDLARMNAKQRDELRQRLAEFDGEPA